MSQAWNVLGSQARPALCNRNSGSVSGAFLSHSQRGRALLQENSGSWGKRKSQVPVGWFQQLLGQDSAITQRLMLVGLSLAPWARRSVSVQETPGLQPWQLVSLCAISHTCCPHSHPRAVLALGGEALPRHSGLDLVLCRMGSPPRPPFPSLLSLQHQKVNYTGVVCD